MDFMLLLLGLDAGDAAADACFITDFFMLGVRFIATGDFASFFMLALFGVSVFILFMADFILTSFSSKFFHKLEFSPRILIITFSNLLEILEPG